MLNKESARPFEAKEKNLAELGQELAAINSSFQSKQESHHGQVMGFSFAQTFLLVGKTYEHLAAAGRPEAERAAEFKNVIRTLSEADDCLAKETSRHHFKYDNGSVINLAETNGANGNSKSETIRHNDKDQERQDFRLLRDHLRQAHLLNLQAMVQIYNQDFCRGEDHIILPDHDELADMDYYKILQLVGSFYDSVKTELPVGSNSDEAAGERRFRIAEQNMAVKILKQPGINKDLLAGKTIYDPEAGKPVRHYRPDDSEKIFFNNEVLKNYNHGIVHAIDWAPFFLRMRYFNQK